MTPPTLTCCKPWLAHTPPPSRWMHRYDCPDYPNQPVGEEQAHPAGQGKTRWSFGLWDGFAQWNRSPLIGPMDYWAAYFDGHLDDWDDERSREGQDA